MTDVPPLFDANALAQAGLDPVSDPEETAEEIDFFLTQIDGHRHRMSGASDAELREEVHRLGSSAALFGLMRLSTRCRAAEKKLAASEPAQAEIDQLLAEMPEDLAGLRALRNELLG